MRKQEVVYTRFAQAGTVLAAEQYDQDGGWERQREKFRQEHDREREQAQAEGFVLSDAFYVDAPPYYDGRVGEWRSVILASP